jgi:hypothetical protein
MKRFIKALCSLIVLFVFAGQPAGASTEPLPPKEEYVRMLKVQNSVIGSENISRSFYNDMLVKEIFTHGSGDAARPGSASVEWQDKGTRWERIDRDGQQELGKTVIYKRGFNISGHLEGRRVDDIFSPQYLFDRGWDFGVSRVRARLIADSHIAQILVIRAAPGSVEREILFSDPSLDIERINALEDAGEGGRILLHVTFKGDRQSAGSLVLFDSEGRETLLGRKVTAFGLSPSRRFCAFNALDENGRSTLEVHRIGLAKPEFANALDSAAATSFMWSPDERFMTASLSQGEERSCARVEMKKGDFRLFAKGAFSVSASPSCRYAVFARKNQKYDGLNVVSVDRAAGRASLKDEKGASSEKALSEISDFSTLYLCEIDSGKEEKAGQSLSPLLEKARWSRDEGECHFIDCDSIYRLSAAQRGRALQAVAGLAATGSSGAATALCPLDRDLFLVQAGDTIYRINGFKSVEPFIEKAVSFKANDSGSELAYLVKGHGGFGLSLFNLKSRDELSIMEGSREVCDYQWLARSGAVFRVVLQPNLVSFEDPVVLLFNEKGDELPLDLR